MYNGHEPDRDDDGVTIRSAGNDEWDAIDLLAQLDSAPPPPRDEMLVAEIGGELRAAVAVRDGYAIANPFEPSVGLIELLRARVAQMRDQGADPTPSRRRVRSWPAWRRPAQDPQTR